MHHQRHKPESIIEAIKPRMEPKPLIKENDNDTCTRLDQQYYRLHFQTLSLPFWPEGARLWDVEGREYIDALGGDCGL